MSSVRNTSIVSTRFKDVVVEKGRQGEREEKGRRLNATIAPGEPLPPLSEGRELELGGRDDGRKDEERKRGRRNVGNKDEMKGAWKGP
jgi:hypothetical protein